MNWIASQQTSPFILGWNSIVTRGVFLQCNFSGCLCFGRVINDIMADKPPKLYPVLSQCTQRLTYSILMQMLACCHWQYLCSTSLSWSRQHEDGSYGKCMGSLVTPRFILSAAHCFKFTDTADKIKVTIGKNQGTTSHSSKNISTSTQSFFFN